MIRCIAAVKQQVIRATHAGPQALGSTMNSRKRAPFSGTHDASGLLGRSRNSSEGVPGALTLPRNAHDAQWMCLGVENPFILDVKRCIIREE
jgi:hypothetical protein